MTKQQQYILAGAGVVIVLGVAGALLLRKGTPPTETPPAAVTPVGQTPKPATATANKTAATKAAPAKAPKMTPAQAKQAARAKAPFPGGPGKGIFANAPKPGSPLNQTAPAGAKVPGAPGATAPVVASMPHKPGFDTFKVSWQRPLPPPYIFDVVQPQRLASANVTPPPPPNTEVREVPTRRVSGIMSGEGVYAILEGGNGEPEIVKPGSVTSDGYRVVAITADSVKLQKREGNVTRTQVVQLSDIPAGGPQTAAFRQPAGPGMMTPPSGFPGLRGPRGGKAGGRGFEE